MNQNLNNEEGSIRRELCRRSLKLFAETYFPHYCKLKFAPFHLALMRTLQEITKERGKHFGMAAPRGNAKSSIVSTIYLAWTICYKLETCIVIFSNTKGQALKILSNLKDELAHNGLLQQDFPDVCEMPNPRWKNEEITTRNNVNVSVASTGTKTRGIRHKESRPSAILLDDIESEDNTRTEAGREKIHDWFTNLVLNLGDSNTNYVMVGTILHFDSLLARLTSGEEFPGFEKSIYRSVIKFSDQHALWDQWKQIFWGKEKYLGEAGPSAARKYFSSQEGIMLRGTEVLWPEKESYYDLMVMKAQKGELSFDSEKQNQPRDMSSYTVDMKAIEYWEDEYRSFEALKKAKGDKVLLLGAIDPSVGKTRRSDLSAIVSVLLDRDNKTFYVVGVDVGRWDLKTIVQKIKIHNEIYGYSQFICESNGSQDWLRQAVNDANLNVPLRALNNNSPKDDRLLRLISLIQSGRVKLCRKFGELIRELSYYPHAKYDDAIDALAMAVDGGNDLFRWDPDLLLKLLKRCAGTDGAGSSEIKSYGGRPVDPVTAALMRGIVK